MVDGTNALVVILPISGIMFGGIGMTGMTGIMTGVWGEGVASVLLTGLTTGTVMKWYFV